MYMYASILDKAPRLSISIVIWILSSDTVCQLNQFNTNSEAAMLSIPEGCQERVGLKNLLLNFLMNYQLQRC